MATMLSYRLTSFGSEPEFMEVQIPTPGDGEVLIKMAGAGLCHSDLHVIDAEPGYWPDPPYTLGHENAGYIAKVGSGVDSTRVGEPVLVTGLDSCGLCAQCVSGRDNYCWRPATMAGRGVGSDGGLATYMVAPARHVVSIDGLDPREAAPLADAGATSYHAVKQVARLLPPGSTAVVIGVGGLGSYAVQYLKLLTKARVVIVETDDKRREWATTLGADFAVAPTDSAAEQIRDVSLGGANVVLDFVGSDSTLDLATSVVGVQGHVTIIGMAQGVASVGWGRIASGATVGLSMGYTLSDLREVAHLGASGALRSDNVYFPFTDTAAAYRALRSGDFFGRIVVTF